MAAIRFENVSKRYTRGGNSRSIREALTASLARPFARRSAEAASREFWALKDVSFRLEPTQALGIIGPNGAGKTTILKLLSRITTPTKGVVAVNGKVASLIELGAGFHPELTGRENIFLNGSILGLSRAEIRRKLDSIVEFAGVGPFLDTPVKQFSSGMYVRLGFAVATHVDAEVLLVDEVLAVGDIPFQRRCLQRLNQFREEGRAIVFVSHNLNAVRSVANQALYLHGGEVRASGAVEPVVSRYIDDTGGGPRRGAEGTIRRPAVPARSEPRIVAVELLDGAGQETAAVPVGAPLRVRIHYETPVSVRRPSFGISIWTEEGIRIATVDTKFDASGPPAIAGTGWIECRFPSLPLLPRRYLVKGGVYDGETGWPYDRWGWDDAVLSFQIETSPQHTPYVVLTEEHGLVRLPASWNWGTGNGAAAAAP
jgi:lipopolysaccharide transport system ATP-binding protein